jgi:polyhydroxyalkanoate synthase
LLDWRPELGPAPAALKESLDGVDPEALEAALGGEICRRLDAFLSGILAYRRHPYRRRLADPPTVWSEGPMRLLDYGACAAEARNGPPVLVVPALINRAYVLDLSERRSLLRYLAMQGLRPMLMDWGAPGEVERGFALTDYIAGRLESALDTVLSLTGRKPVLVGYCMGGLLALALAARRQDDLRALVALATPFDFHAGNSHQARLAAAQLGPLTPLIERLGELPVDVLQAMFATIDPLGGARKFCAFASLAESARARSTGSTQAQDFVALEDWLNDGVPLVAAVAEECLAGWYGANTPARGEWRVAGRPVSPSEVRLRALVVAPENDRIVPPESTKALAAALPDADLMVPPLGHIGMIVASRAEALVWRPLVDWLKAAPRGAETSAARPRRRSAKRARLPRRSP